MQRLPLRLFGIQQQRLAHARRGERHAVPHARTHLQAFFARDLLQVKHLVVVAHGQVDGVARQIGQAVQIGARQGRHREGLARLETQFDQLRPQHITHARQGAQIAFLHQATGQPVRGAARHADARADLFQVARAVGHGLHDGQAAHQRLRAGGRGGIGVQDGQRVGSQGGGGHEDQAGAAGRSASIPGAVGPECVEIGGIPRVGSGMRPLTGRIGSFPVCGI
ncbi:hypothetical protein D3C71_350060 [compost metagenome]